MNSYISKVLTALRHHDTPNHLRRGELLQSQKMVQKVEGLATRGHVFRGHLCGFFSVVLRGKEKKENGAAGAPGRQGRLEET